MKLNPRSYPHPVLGNRDDIPNAAFQATVEMSADKLNLYLDVMVSCSSATINDLVDQGAACFAAHVECSNTLFRRLFELRAPKDRITIPVDGLNDSVEVNVIAKANRAISNYLVPEAHTDYGHTSFEVKKGDVLAIGEGLVFPIESPFDAMGRVGSIMQMKEAAEDGDQPMTVNSDGDKIIVILSKPDFAAYKLLRNDDTLVAPLTVAIVLPVLLDALTTMQKEERIDGEFPLRWQRVLQRRMRDAGLSDEVEPLIVAQRLLELPIKRALATTHQLAEANS